MTALTDLITRYNLQATFNSKEKLLTLKQEAEALGDAARSLIDIITITLAVKHEDEEAINILKAARDSIDQDNPFTDENIQDTLKSYCLVKDYQYLGALQTLHIKDARNLLQRIANHHSSTIIMRRCLRLVISLPKKGPGNIGKTISWRKKVKCVTFNDDHFEGHPTYGSVHAEETLKFLQRHFEDNPSKLSNATVSFHVESLYVLFGRPILATDQAYQDILEWARRKLDGNPLKRFFYMPALSFIKKEVRRCEKQKALNDLTAYIKGEHQEDHPAFLSNARDKTPKALLKIAKNNIFHAYVILNDGKLFSRSEFTEQEAIALASQFYQDDFLKKMLTKFYPQSPDKEAFLQKLAQHLPQAYRNTVFSQGRDNKYTLKAEFNQASTDPTLEAVESIHALISNRLAIAAQHLKKTPWQLAFGKSNATIKNNGHTFFVPAGIKALKESSSTEEMETILKAKLMTGAKGFFKRLLTGRSAATTHTYQQCAEILKLKV